MDNKPIKYITALADLYKVIFKSESTKEVDFLLEALHDQGEAIRKQNEEISLFILSGYARIRAMRLYGRKSAAYAAHGARFAHRAHGWEYQTGA